MPHTRERRARLRSAVRIYAQRCRIFSEDVNNVAGRAQTAAVYSCVNTSLLCSRPDLLLCRLVCLSVCLLVRELLPDSGALRSLQFVCLHAFYRLEATFASFPPRLPTIPRYSGITIFKTTIRYSFRWPFSQSIEAHFQRGGRIRIAFATNTAVLDRLWS